MATLFDSDTERSARARVEALRPDAAARWGKMNARQMICHLTDSFRVALGEVPVVPKWTPLRLSLLRRLFVFTLPIPGTRGSVPFSVIEGSLAARDERVLGAEVREVGVRVLA